MQKRAEHDKGEDHRRGDRQRRSVNAVGQKKKLFYKLLRADAGMRQPAGELVAPQPVGQKCAGNQHQRPAGCTACGFKNKTNENNPVDHVARCDVIHITDAGHEAGLLGKHIVGGGKGQNNQNDIKRLEDVLFPDRVIIRVSGGDHDNQRHNDGEMYGPQHMGVQQAESAGKVDLKERKEYRQCRD